MKKLMTMAIAAMLTIGGYVSVANAEGFYVGTDYVVTKQRGVVAGAEDTTNGVNLHVGTKFTDFVGAEVGVTSKLTEVGAGGARVDLTTLNADLIGYVPVAESLDVLLTGGVTYTMANVKGASNEREWGYAVGTGLQYGLTEKVSLRGLVKYENVDLKSFGSQDGAFRYSAGINLHF